MILDSTGHIRCGDCHDAAIPCGNCQSLMILEYRLGDPERVVAWHRDNKHDNDGGLIPV